MVYGRGMKILVAQYDEAYGTVVRKYVEQLGHHVTSVDDGASAWELVQRTFFDVVISDWMLPKVEGLELCRRVRRLSDRPYTYLIILSELGAREHFVAGMEAGADDYLVKPFDRDSLKARLIAAERVTGLHQELAHKTQELKRVNAHLVELSRVDTLTGLGNRLALNEALDAIVLQAQRYGRTHAAALCDVDHFKNYNDCYGHLAGDEVLARLAGTMSDELRTTDRAFRYGGEEFLLLLPEQNLAQASVAMERVRGAVEALKIPHKENPHGPYVTISVGIAELKSERKWSQDQWLQAADDALYRAKAAGRNQVMLAA